LVEVEFFFGGEVCGWGYLVEVLSFVLVVRVFGRRFEFYYFCFNFMKIVVGEGIFASRVFDPHIFYFK
jgi:hypothetical protein